MRYELNFDLTFKPSPGTGHGNVTNGPQIRDEPGKEAD